MRDGFRDWLMLEDRFGSPRRYAVLRRNIILATVVGAIVPLLTMALVNY